MRSGQPLRDQAWLVPDHTGMPAWFLCTNIPLFDEVVDIAVPPHVQPAVIVAVFELFCGLEKQNSLECAGSGRKDPEKSALNVPLYLLND